MPKPGAAPASDGRASRISNGAGACEGRPIVLARAVRATMTGYGALSVTNAVRSDSWFIVIALEPSSSSSAGPWQRSCRENPTANHRKPRACACVLSACVRMRMRVRVYVRACVCACVLGASACVRLLCSVGQAASGTGLGMRFARAKPTGQQSCGGSSGAQWCSCLRIRRARVSRAGAPHARGGLMCVRAVGCVHGCLMAVAVRGARNVQPGDGDCGADVNPRVIDHIGTDSRRTRGGCRFMVSDALNAAMRQRATNSEGRSARLLVDHAAVRDQPEVPLQGAVFDADCVEYHLLYNRNRALPGGNRT